VEQARRPRSNGRDQPGSRRNKTRADIAAAKQNSNWPFWDLEKYKDGDYEQEKKHDQRRDQAAQEELTRALDKYASQRW